MDLDAGHILAHVRVDVAAYARGGHPPPHLSAVIACVRSWRVIRAIKSLTMTVHTNNASAVARMLATDEPDASSPSHIRAGKAPAIAWRELVAPWHPGTSSKAKPFLLAHAHLRAWQQDVAADRPENGTTAFVHLEDDVCPNPEGIVSWAEDEALLIASGASAAGFQRGFYRFEVTRAAAEFPASRAWSKPAGNGKYSHAFVAARAAAWRSAHNISLGERFVLDERQLRRFHPAVSRRCDHAPCSPPERRLRAQQRHGGGDGGGSSAQQARDADWTQVALQPAALQRTYCASYPTLAVATAEARAHRVFVALANPYSAITAASRPLVRAFLLHSNGWDLAARGSGEARAHQGERQQRLRTRHKAYAVREYGSCTFHYAHEFYPLPMPEDALDVRWPYGSNRVGDTSRTGGGMRRVLVPLVLARDVEELTDSDAGRGQPASPRPRAHVQRSRHMERTGSSDRDGSSKDIKRTWQLDTLAGVHHMSDRVVNGPRKQVEAYAARFRERELIRCLEKG